MTKKEQKYRITVRIACVPWPVEQFNNLKVGSSASLVVAVGSGPGARLEASNSKKFEGQPEWSTRTIEFRARSEKTKIVFEADLQDASTCAVALDNVEIHAIQNDDYDPKVIPSVAK